MNGHQFTLKAQEALQRAQETAQEHGQQQIEPLHLLSAILEPQDSIAVMVLEKLGIDIAVLREKTREELNRLPRVSLNIPFGQIYLTPDLARVFERARKESQQLTDEYISVEHLFLSLIDTPSRAKDVFSAVSDLQTSGVGGKEALAQGKIDYQTVLKILAEIRGGMRVTDQQPESKYQVLERYARNLTALARKEKLDPVIGRDTEIRRLMQVLSRRTKNNPVLIGEAGVGKTAIVEGLAQRIVQGDIPDSLKDKEIVAKARKEKPRKVTRTSTPPTCESAAQCRKSKAGSSRSPKTATQP